MIKWGCVILCFLWCSVTTVSLAGLTKSNVFSTNQNFPFFEIIAIWGCWDCPSVKVGSVFFFLRTWTCGWCLCVWCDCRVWLWQFTTVKATSPLVTNHQTEAVNRAFVWERWNPWVRNSVMSSSHISRALTVMKSALSLYGDADTDMLQGTNVELLTSGSTCCHLCFWGSLVLIRNIDPFGDPSRRMERWICGLSKHLP